RSEVPAGVDCGGARGGRRAEGVGTGDLEHPGRGVCGIAGGFGGEGLPSPASEAATAGKSHGPSVGGPSFSGPLARAVGNPLGASVPGGLGAVRPLLPVGNAMRHVSKQDWMGCAVATAAMLGDVTYEEVAACRPNLDVSRTRYPKELRALLKDVTESDWRVSPVWVRR